MIQVGDLVRHRRLGGLGLVKRTNTPHQNRWCRNNKHTPSQDSVAYQPLPRWWIHRPMDKTTRKIGEQMNFHIGDLVKIEQGQGKNDIGIVLDYRSTGRFYPSIELTIKLPCGRTIRKDYKRVEKLGENK